jgi:hypothetical protein
MVKTTRTLAFLLFLPFFAGEEEEEAKELTLLELVRDAVRDADEERDAEAEAGDVPEELALTDAV